MAARKKKRSTSGGKMPDKVIESHARRLKKNPRALAIYKRVIGS